MTKNLKQRKMPPTREAITHEFSVGGVRGYLTIGLFEDGTPGEIFINVSRVVWQIKCGTLRCTPKFGQVFKV